MTEEGGVQASSSAVQGANVPEQPLLQDSAVAGNVHVGNVVHQYHVAAGSLGVYRFQSKKGVLYNTLRSL